MSGDDRSWNDGDKLTFSERDRRRREGGGSDDQRPRGVSKAKAESGKKQYLNQIDGLFSAKKGGAEVQQLEAAMRAAHGTPGLAAACRGYLEVAGYPTESASIGMFLDCNETELVAGALRALQAASQSGDNKTSSGLRSQLRVLAEDPNDEIAELAEDLVEQR